jgi:hypothetical protein
LSRELGRQVSGKPHSNPTVGQGLDEGVNVGGTGSGHPGKCILNKNKVEIGLKLTEIDNSDKLHDIAIRYVRLFVDKMKNQII